jgi:hypothetical protein
MNKLSIIFAVAFIGAVKGQNTFPNNGNAGVGTSNPQHEFDVNGDIKASGKLMAGSTFTIDGPNGTLKNTAWQNAVNRVMYADVNGVLLPLAPGTSHQVLYGNSTWGDLPVGATAWDVLNNNTFSTFPGNVGIGTSNPQYKLDVVGDLRVSNNVYVGGGLITTNSVSASVKVSAGDIDVTNNLLIFGTTTFNGGAKFSSFAGSGTGNLVYDNLGNVAKGAPIISCLPNSPQWSVGGDNFVPFAIPGGIFNEASAGTCNNYDFILKSNAVNRQWLKTDGTIGFGTSIGSNTGGPEYRFKTGALRLQSFNSYGGPQIVFDMDNGSTPYGDWGIEYNPVQFTKPGLNFWKPFGSPYAFNNILFLADDGTIGMGTDNPTTRLTLDGWAGDVLKTISTGSNAKSISVNLKSGVNQISETFLVRTDGQTSISYNSLNNSPFIISNSAVSNNNNNKIFEVQPDGKTIIGAQRQTAGPHTNAVLTVYGKAVATEVIVTQQNWFDIVFADNYALRPLSEVEAFYKANKHLPDIPSEKEVLNDGVNVGDMNGLLLKKIEELTIYLVEQEKKIAEQEKKINELNKKIKD